MRKLAFVLLLAACTSTSTPPLPTPPPLTMSETVRAQREQELAAARANYEKNPNDADALIWLGRRTAYLGRYAEAIDIFSEGIRKHPRDARMLRHRGHRWITLRQFDRAIADLTKAASLIRNTPDQIEPDGLPNARNIPTSTLQSNIWYHLGLAHYLKGDFESALRAYRECMAVSKNPDGVVSTGHWLYMTLRRLGRADEAEAVLAPISTDMDVIENTAYHKLLLMYRGEIAPEELLKENDAAIHYGVGNWFLYNGERERAMTLFREIVKEKEWAAFGTIAAESELAR
ncbi:MAG TPA: tetratricopeptide repeat protein [Thermoanaerobaculia bacterium]|nr:tetratricopeptide repeat protein [Thermoanaerobaculia bacterium]